MRLLGINHQAHAVLAGHEAVALLQLQHQSHEVARRLDSMVLECTLEDLEYLRVLCR